MKFEQHALYQAVVRESLGAFTMAAFNVINPGTKFQANWHIDVMAQSLTDVMRGKITRLIITVPPRHLKSILASVALPAFILGHDPWKKIIVVSYADDLVQALSHQARQLVDSAEYKSIFPNVALSKNQNTQTTITTNMGGFRRGISIGGSVTGIGGDILIIDDPLKPEDAMSEAKRKAVNDTYDSTLYSRLNDRTTGAIIVIMQRLHENDLVGHLLEKGDDWTVINLPAIAQENERHVIYNLRGEAKLFSRAPGEPLHPARFSLAQLKQIENTLTPRRYSSQYLQQPTPDAGGIVMRDWLKFYGKLPDDKPRRIVHSWDTASKDGLENDYSVGTIWHEYSDGFYLVDVIRERLKYPELKLRVIEVASRTRPHAVLIEDKASGIQLIQDLRHNSTIAGLIVAIATDGDKLSRFEGQSDKFHGGRVFLPQAAPWLEIFINEITRFPASKHDDQVDSVSQALKHLTSHNNVRLRIL